MEPSIVTHKGRGGGDTLRSLLGPLARVSRETRMPARLNPGLLLAVWLMAVAGARLYLALSHDTFLGIDGGAYLLGMYQFWGNGPEQAGFDRPPLAPGYLLVPFVWAFGVSPLGYNLYAALGSMVLWPFFWLLARRILPVQWAVLATVLLSLDWEQWIMFVTGVVPVFGFSGLCVALWAMLSIAEGPQLRGPKLALILAIPLIALLNQTSAGLALLSLSAAWLALPNKRIIGGWLAAGGALALLVALPWYQGVLPGGERVAVPGQLFFLVPLTEYQWLQAAMVAVTLLGIEALWRRAERRPLGIKMLVYVVAAHVSVLLVWSSDEALQNILFRGGIWLMAPLWVLVAWAASQLLPGFKTWFSGAVVAAALLSGAAGAAWLYQQQEVYSTHMSRDVLDAVQALDMDTVTRIGTNGESRAYWLSAVTGKPVAWLQQAPPQPAYVEQELQARCELGWLPNCAAGFVSHWIVDRTDRQQAPAPILVAPNPQNPWSQIGQDAPWLELVWQQGQVEVWESPTTHRAVGS